MSEYNDLKCFSEEYQIKVLKQRLNEVQSYSDEMFNDMSDSKQIKVLKHSINYALGQIQELKIVIKELTEEKS
jgi:hypothetical protein